MNTHAKRMRRWLSLVWLAATVECVGGCKGGVSAPNDAESERFVNAVVSEVVVPGTPITYGKEATRELLQHFSAKQFSQLSVRVQASCGQPTGPGNTSGFTQTIFGSADGTTKIAKYVNTTPLQCGTATTIVSAAKKNNKWQLTGITVTVQPSSHS